MYLSRLCIKNFRTFKFIELDFNSGVNILIGENNSGKSAIIDALRICFGYGKSEKDIHIKESDLYINQNNPLEKNREIRFDLIFEIGNNPMVRECFYDFISLKDNKETIQFHLKFELEDRGKRKYFNRTVWGGDNEGQSIPYEALQEIFYTYLSPLRDAISGLKPYSYDNKTSQLYNQLTKFNKGEDEIELTEKLKDELAKDLYSIFENNAKDWVFILNEGQQKVNEHLEGTGIKKKYPDIDMNYVGRKFSDIVRGIELKRPVFKPEKLNGCEQQYFMLHQNGLGENNLIYTSVILGDLINRSEDTGLELYNALLVEEPEAHLHPQYQNTFFSYLNELEKRGLQIFITSHSPTITAKADLKNITVLQKQNNNIAAFAFSKLTDTDFNEKNHRHLKKFLDTTKSQMFFASGTILVEGVAEALLIPELAKKFLKPKIYDLEKEGIELVNIGGVAFEHFAKLFNNKDAKKRLLSKCAIITDSDPEKDKPVSDRAAKAKKLEGNNLVVRLAPNTLEHDLFDKSTTNKKIMQEVYRTMHKDTEELKGDFDSNTLMCKLKSNRDKGDFALNLADKLKTISEFDVPDYIKEAIEFVVSANKDDSQKANI